MTNLHPLDLFGSGHDTAHIAVMLGIDEFEVYNRMAQEREARLKALQQKARRQEERARREQEREDKRAKIRDMSLRFIERRNAGQFGEAHQ